MYCLPFSAIGADQFPLAGGKCTNLGIIASNGFPVPPGFCVTTRAYQEFVQTSPAVMEAIVALDNVPSTESALISRCAAAVRAQIEATPVPESISAEIIASFNRSGSDLLYAVRSSATAEDLPGASFAGQHDSFLNVAGPQRIVAAVASCWASLFTERAAVYRRVNGFTSTEVSLAVGVQQMVAAEAAGVAFSADPASGCRNVVAIDASFGLGEAVVSGLTNTDAYRVGKRPLAMLSVRVAHKSTAIFATPGGGGTSTETLPPTRADMRVLCEEVTLELARHVIRVEEVYGAPMDVEWAVVGGHVYLVQARQITTLFPVPQKFNATRPNDRFGGSDERVYISLAHQQMMTDAFSPAGISVFAGFVSGTFAGQMRPYVATAGQRIFIDATHVLANPLLRRLVLGVVGQFDDIMKRTLSSAASRPAVSGAEPVSVRAYLGIVALIMKNGVRALVRSPEVVVADHLSRVQAWRDATKAVADRHNDPSVTGYVSDVFDQMVEGSRVMPYLIPNLLAGTASLKILAKLGFTSRADPADVVALGRGFDGNVTTEMDLAVGDLCVIAERCLPVQRALRDGHLMDALAVPEFRAAVDDFNARFGHRGPGEIDIARPRYADDPRLLLQVVRSHLSADGSVSARQRHAALKAEAIAATERVSTAAALPPVWLPRVLRPLWFPIGSIRRAWTARWIRLFRAIGAIREHHKFFLVLMLAMVRAHCVARGALLVERGVLARAEDVFLLSVSEMETALSHDTSLQLLVEARRSEQAIMSAMSVPRVITSSGERLAAPLPPGVVIGPNMLIGTPVSSGMVEGIAAVIRDPTIETLPSRHILVAPFTDPGWTPLFLLASGVVLEVGGAMSHGSVIAREYGLPAVAGVSDALTRIQSGDHIRLDGDAGTVEVLRRANDE